MTTHKDAISKTELLGILDRAEAELKELQNEGLNFSFNQHQHPLSSDDAGAVLLPKSGGERPAIG